MIAPEERQNFFDLLLPIAKAEQDRSQIAPLITITQAAHESNWGQSELTVKANNLFGFTGDKWETEGKPVIKLPTREFVDGKWIPVQRPFRSYSSWAESVRDWAALMQIPRYAVALAAARQNDIDTFAIEVARAGYATDPHYADNLIEVGDRVDALLADADSAPDDVA